MSTIRFEKFEMKFGYYLPEEFKKFMNKYGGDAQFGSCRFEYPENIINNILRVPGKMDFHLVPFGDVGNGDYYCFYKYGEKIEEYFVGIWLHETGNFVILTSSFEAFLYKCVLDDYLTTIPPNEDFSESENALFAKECMERSEKLALEYGFDFEKVRALDDEFDYHALLAEFDDHAIQSHCYVGLKLVKNHDVHGIDVLDRIREAYPPYIAPNYLLGKALCDMGREGKSFFMKALRGSLVLTGYSYWEEDYISVPEDVHREMELYVDSLLIDSEDLMERKLYFGEDPYSFEFRLQLAHDYMQRNEFAMAMIEFNNAIFCCNNKPRIREILGEALQAAGIAGYGFLVGIIEQDIKKVR